MVTGEGCNLLLTDSLFHNSISSFLYKSALFPLIFIILPLVLHLPFFCVFCMLRIIFDLDSIPPCRIFIFATDQKVVQSSLQSKTRLQKAFSPNASAFSLWYSPLQWAYGRVRVPRDLHSLFYNCPVLAHFPSDFSFSRWEWGWGWVHIGSLESMLRTTIVSDGTSSIHQQASLDFSSEDRSNT